MSNKTTHMHHSSQNIIKYSEPFTTLSILSQMGDLPAVHGGGHCQWGEFTDRNPQAQS